MKVLITREFAEPLASMLEDAGLSSVHVPCVRLLATGLPPPVGPPPDSVLITSAAVVRFVPGLASVIDGARVVAVGPKTAAALRKCSIDVEDVGHRGGKEALVTLQQGPARNPWYIGAKKPSEQLRSALLEHEFKCWSVYENVEPLDLSSALRSKVYDAVVFASGSAVEAYVNTVGVPSVPVVVLGDATRTVASEHGVSVAAMARAPTMEAVVAAICGIR